MHYLTKIFIIIDDIYRGELNYSWINFKKVTPHHLFS